MLQFNIFYTPGTVRDFRLFALSLIKHTRNCTFRLVANGCTPGEVALLRILCDKYDRLELYEFPSHQMESHASVTGLLQQRETSDYFCILDSDILATGDFVADLMPLLDSHQAVFSGRNLWILPEETILTSDVKRVGGHYNSTPSGLYVGGTYCAIYNNRALNNLLSNLHPSFPIWHKRTWNNIPRPYQQWLAAQGVKHNWYDTAKILNLLMQKQGYKLTSADSPSLHHVGGLSVFRWYKLPDKFYNRRALVGTYLNTVFDSLYTGRPIPSPPSLDHPSMEAQLKFVAEQLQALYSEFGGELAAAEKAVGYVHTPAPSDSVQAIWRRYIVLWLHRRRIAILPPGSERERLYFSLRRRLTG